MYHPFAKRTWHLAHNRSLDLGPSAILMGILNVTPDSFSDGGKFDRVSAALSHAKMMIKAGASIIDVGGESTRPGADPVSQEEEQARVLPVIRALAELNSVIISVDTYRASTAEAAIAAGAHIINDVWGFQKDPDIAFVASKSAAGVCAMHTGRERSKLADLVEDQLSFLGVSLTVLENAGVHSSNIVLDPGFGFAKDTEDNIELLSNLEKLHSLGSPLLIGTSRKRFIGAITGRDAEDRDIGTAATSAVARMKGGAIFRVHDVAANRDALAVADAVIAVEVRDN